MKTNTRSLDLATKEKRKTRKENDGGAAVAPPQSPTTS